jgi:hypothetical protein
MSEEAERIILADGKYSVVLESNPHCFYALRHNTDWIAGRHLDNLHLAMFQRIRYLEKQLYNGVKRDYHGE